MGTNTILSAKEARHIADTTAAMKNHLYKQIKEEANDGRVQTEWCVYGCSEVNKESLIKELKTNGYDVTVPEEDPTILLIKW